MSDYFQSIVSDQNIENAILSINRKASPGPDGKTMEQSLEFFRNNQAKLVTDLSSSAYHTAPPKRIYYGEKKRPLDILNIQDRIIQRMFSQVLGGVYDGSFSESSHGFRPGRGRHTAIKQALELINSGKQYLLQLDISKYFQNIDRNLLMDLLRQKVDEPNILHFISDCICVGYTENGQQIQTEKGIPQGSSLSPLLSNIYLNELDQELDSRRIPFVRFADDALILTESREQAEVVKAYLDSWLPQTLGLTLSQEKTRIVTPDNCHILGYQIIKSKDGYICDPPLPAEKKSRTRTDNERTAASGAVQKQVDIKSDPQLKGLKDLDLASYKNKWIPKDKAKKLRDSINAQISIASLAAELGYTVLIHSSDTLTLAEHDSCIIWPETNRFKRFSQTDKNGRAVGGGPLDFYMHFEQVPYFQALNVFAERLSTDKENLKTAPTVKLQEKMTPLQRDLSLHDEIKRRNRSENDGMRNVYAYLIKTRKIDPEIVSEQVKKGCIQQITDDKGRTQCIFIGRDENGLYSGVCFRSTSSTNKFMGDFPGCSYEHGWFFDPEWDQSSLCLLDQPTKPNPGKQLLCFESYIEMLSYMTILKQQGFDYRKFAYLSCGSVTKSQSIERTCERYGFKKIKIMFNNDRDQEIRTGSNPGKEAAERTVKSLTDKGYNASILLPSKENDWNDTLVKGSSLIQPRHQSNRIQQERN